jgi:hypothetical protein
MAASRRPSASTVSCSRFPPAHRSRGPRARSQRLPAGGRRPPPVRAKAAWELKRTAPGPPPPACVEPVAWGSFGWVHRGPCVRANALLALTRGAGRPRPRACPGPNPRPPRPHCAPAPRACAGRRDVGDCGAFPSPAPPAPARWRARSRALEWGPSMAWAAHQRPHAPLLVRRTSPSPAPLQSAISAVFQGEVEMPPLRHNVRRATAAQRPVPLGGAPLACFFLGSRSGGPLFVRWPRQARASSPRPLCQRAARHPGPLIHPGPRCCPSALCLRGRAAAASCWAWQRSAYRSSPCLPPAVVTPPVLA